MLCDVECLFHAVVPAKDLDSNGSVHQSLIITRLLKQLSNVKVTEDLGYFLAVTELKSIGNAKFDDSSKYILFPVTFVCRTFLPVNGEIMLGVVRKVHSSGVFLKCGPMNYVYLSSQKMPNYYYVPNGKNPFFSSDNLSRIEKDVVVRFRVFALRWTSRKNEREIMILATLEGDCLGPISLAGSDEMEL